MTDVQRFAVEVTDGASRVLDKIGRGFDRMGQGADAVGNRVTRGMNKAATALDKVSAKADNAGQRLKGLGQGAMGVGQQLTAGVTVPIAAAGAGILKVAGDFEQAMNGLRGKVGLDAASAEFRQLRDLAKELGSTTRFSASQAASAMDFLAMAGFDANEILAATPGLLDLASAGQLDLASAADIASNVMSASERVLEKYGGTAERIAAVNDILAKTANSANTDIKQLGDAYVYAAGSANAIGLPLEASAAALGILADRGSGGAKGGAALDRVLSRLNPSGKQAAEAMAELGFRLEDFMDGAGNLSSDGLVDVIDHFATLDERARAAGDEGVAQFGRQLERAFGLEGKRAVLDLIGGFDDLEGRITANAEAVGGYAKGIAAINNEGFNASLDRLKSSLEGLAIEIADSGLLDDAADGLDKISGLIDQISNQSPGVLRLVTIAAMGAAAIGPVILGAGALTASLGSVITFGGKAFAVISKGAAFAAPLVGKLSTLIVGGAAKAGAAIASASSAALPAIGSAVAAAAPLLVTAAALAAAGYLVYKNWDGIAEQINKIELPDADAERLTAKIGVEISNTSDIVEALFQRPLATIGAVSSEYAMAFGDIWDGFWQSTNTAARNFKTKTEVWSSLAGDLWNGVGDGLRRVGIEANFQTTRLSTAAADLWSGSIAGLRIVVADARLKLAELKTAASNAATEALDRLMSLRDGLVNGFNDLLDRARNVAQGGLDAIENVRTAIVDAFTGLRDRVQEALSSIPNPFANLRAPSFSTPSFSAGSIGSGVASSVRPSFAGNIPASLGGLVNAARREAMMMPAGASLAMANTSELILPQREAMSVLAPSARPASVGVAAYQNTSNSSSPTYNFNTTINLPPGTSPDDERLVQMVIGRLNRELKSWSAGLA